MNKPLTGVTRRKLRSSEWFNDPHNPGMTALYLERYLNYGLTRQELQSGKPIIGIAQTGNDLSPCNRHHLELAHRVREGIRAAGGIAMEFPTHPIQETGKTSDRGARPQTSPILAGRNPVRLSARRRGADHRLRQDDPGLSDGGRDRQPACDRALGRPDAERLVQRRALRLRYRGLEIPRTACRGRDRLRGVHEHRGLLGAVDRPLQHHGHRLDHEFAGRGARHVAARMRRDPRSLSRARADRL